MFLLKLLSTYGLDVITLCKDKIYFRYKVIEEGEMRSAFPDDSCVLTKINKRNKKGATVQFKFPGGSACIMK